MVFHPREPSPREGPGQAAAPERVARALARAGVSSRRDAERMIEEGRVAINGRVLTSPAVNVGPNDILTLDGKPIAEAEAVRVWRYHKPAGLLTTHKDPKGRPTVFDALPKEMGRVISVGRLDLNSEGVLLLTNDGGLARSLELPSNGWVRRYRARAFGRTTQAKLDAIKHGVTIEGVDYGPVEAVMEKSGGGSNIWLTVAISEGKNREVRRVLEHLGLKVNRLIRVSYGPFDLGDVQTGSVAEVPPRMIRELLSHAIAPAQMPKGDRRMFNWTPDGAQRRKPAAASHAPVSAPPERDRSRRPGAVKHPPARMSAPQASERTRRLAGAAHDRAPGAGGKRAPAPPKSAGPEPIRRKADGPTAADHGDGFKRPAQASSRSAPPGGERLGTRPAASAQPKEKPAYKAGWARPKPKALAKKPAVDGAPSTAKAPRRPKR